MKLFIVTFQVTENRNETPTEDCVLDCPKTDIPCQLQTCCGPSKQVFIYVYIV